MTEPRPDVWIDDNRRLQFWRDGDGTLRLYYDVDKESCDQPDPLPGHKLDDYEEAGSGRHWWIVAEWNGIDEIMAQCLIYELTGKRDAA